MRWTHEILISKAFIRQRPVINIVTLVHGLLVAKKLSRNPGQLKWVTWETRYYVPIAELLKWNLLSHIVELFQRPRTMLKILYFSGDQHSFQNSLGINFLMTGVATFSYTGRGGTFSKIIKRAGHQGASHWGTWTRCLKNSQYWC